MLECFLRVIRVLTIAPHFVWQSINDGVGFFIAISYTLCEWEYLGGEIGKRRSSSSRDSRTDRDLILSVASLPPNPDNKKYTAMVVTGKLLSSSLAVC